jgi:calcineurin-like phosphoesterase
LHDGRKLLVAQVMGRLFMDPLDCPFQAAETLLSRHRLGQTIDAAIIDFHGEATSEKMAFAHIFDGRVSAVVGTHTHVPTADHQILDGGTAFCADLGMCGDYNSVIGMAPGAAAQRLIRKMPGEKLSPAEGPATICGAFIETAPTGLALRIEPLRQGPRLAPAFPGM